MAILIFIAFLILKALYTYTGVGIMSVNEVMLKKRADDGDELFIQIAAQRKNGKRFSHRMQMGSALAGIAGSAYLAYDLSGIVLEYLENRSAVPWLGGLSVFLTAVAGGIIMQVFGHYLPRQIAISDPLKTSRRMIRFSGTLQNLAAPFAATARFLTVILFRLFKIREDDQQRITEEEIRLMVDVSRESGNIAISEKEMIENIFEFNDKTAEEIMTHRTQIVGIDVSATLEEAVQVMLDENYSRVPVYNQRLDDIVGVLHIKDVMRCMAEHVGSEFNVMQYARPPYFAPQSKTVDALFKDMQLKHHQMAIIIDEYGGTAGMVTQEDILEEIVGSLQDEYDEEPQMIIHMPDGSYIIEASAGLEELEREIPELVFTDEEKDSYDTLAGLIIGRLDRIPEQKEYPDVLNGNYRLKVILMDERRIEQVRLWLLEEEPEAEQPDYEPTN